MTAFGTYRNIHYLVKSDKDTTFGGSPTLEGARKIMASQNEEYKDFPKAWGERPVFHIEKVD